MNICDVPHKYFVCSWSKLTAHIMLKKPLKCFSKIWVVTDTIRLPNETVWHRFSNIQIFFWRTKYPTHGLGYKKIYSGRKILRIGFPTETILNTWCSKAVLQTSLEQVKTIEEITIFDFSMICLSFCWEERFVVLHGWSPLRASFPLCISPSHVFMALITLSRILSTVLS